MSGAEQRRQTPTERNHELLKLALERHLPASLSPSFKVAQVKAVGGATVFEWDVHVPVCDEYPDAEQAFNAVTEYAGCLRRLYPPPNGDASLAAQLQESIDKAPPSKPRRVK